MLLLSDVKQQREEEIKYEDCELSVFALVESYVHPGRKTPTLNGVSTPVTNPTPT